MPRDVSASGQMNEPPKQTSLFGTVELCECRSCGRKNMSLANMKCRNLIYFAVNCWTWLYKSVLSSEGGDTQEVFQVSTLGADVDQSQCDTLKLDSVNYVCFKVDTGIYCNIKWCLLIWKGQSVVNSHYLTVCSHQKRRLCMSGTNSKRHTPPTVSCKGSVDSAENRVFLIKDIVPKSILSY